MEGKIPYSLKNARQLAELTQEEVAKKLNISTATLSNWESGKTSPKIKQYKALCSLYNLALDEILT